MADLLVVAIAALAVWRLARIVVIEDGPLDLVDRFRREVVGHPRMDTWIQRGFACVGCVSFWIGLGVSLALGGEALTIVLRGLAFSAVSVILAKRVN